MSGAASAGDHASDWSLAIHFNAFGWSPAWSLCSCFASSTASVGGHTSDWSLCRSLPYYRLVACMVACVFGHCCDMPSWGFLEKSLLEKSNSFQQSTRQVTGRLLYILYGKSRSLVQLNVAYVLTALYRYVFMF